MLPAFELPLILAGLQEYPTLSDSQSPYNRDMRDGPLRGGIKTVARARFFFDLGITRSIRRMRGQPGYELRGECVCSGDCCETPMIQVHPLLFYATLFKRLFLAWQRHVNGFEFVRAEREGYVFVFDCTHFDQETRRCDSYSTRPGWCHDYPRTQLWSTNPQFLTDCGYYALSKKAGCVRQALAHADMTPEQRAEIERRLHLLE